MLALPNIPGYRVLELLGQGGFAAVYRAVQESLDREVALKLLPEDGLGADAGARFLREGKLLAKLSHPRLLRVFDAGRAGNRLFLVTELMPGGSLRELVEEQAPLSDAELARRVSDIASGVGHAHDAGIVHRDLKPDNVLVDSRGQIKIADFGLARPIAATATSTFRTAAGMIVGTIGYIAPEVLVGGPPEAASDVYAIGVMAFEMATGRYPLPSGGVAEVAAGRFDLEARRISRVRPDFPAELDALVARCLDPRPGQRPTAKSLADALESYLLRHHGTQTLECSTRPMPSGRSAKTLPRPKSVAVVQVRAPSGGWGLPFAKAASAILVAVVVFLVWQAPARRVEVARPQEMSKLQSATLGPPEVSGQQSVPGRSSVATPPEMRSAQVSVLQDGPGESYGLALASKGRSVAAVWWHVGVRPERLMLRESADGGESWGAAAELGQTDHAVTAPRVVWTRQGLWTIAGPASRASRKPRAWFRKTGKKEWNRPLELPDYLSLPIVACSLGGNLDVFTSIGPELIRVRLGVGPFAAMEASDSLRPAGRAKLEGLLGVWPSGSGYIFEGRGVTRAEGLGDAALQTPELNAGFIDFPPDQNPLSAATLFKTDDEVLDHAALLFNHPLGAWESA